MIIHLKPWIKAFSAFNDKAFMRRAYFSDGDFIALGNIVIMECYDSRWVVERPFANPIADLSGDDGTLTPESLMFKIDLYLMDSDKYVVDDPFVFPDNNY